MPSDTNCNGHVKYLSRLYLIKSTAVHAIHHMISLLAVCMHINGAWQIALSSAGIPLDTEVHLTGKPPLRHNLSQTFPGIILLQSPQGGICLDQFHNALFI